MPMPALRIVLSRENFRDLVAGREVRFQPDPTTTIIVNLNLDREGGMTKYSDPPEAREFLKRPTRIGIKSSG